MEFVKKNIKYIGLVGCVIVALATFLPFVTVTISFLGYSSSESVTFIEGDGKFVIVLAIISGLMLFGKTMKNLRIFNIKLESLLKFWWGPIVPVAIGLFITIHDAIDVNSVTDSYGSYGDISFGIGFYLILLGSIVAVASILYEKFVMKVDTASQRAIEDSSVVSTTTYAYQQPVQPVVSETQVESVQSTPVMQPGMVSCPGCGSQMPSTSKFCTICGKQLQ